MRLDRPPHLDHLKFLGAYSKQVVDLAIATRALVLREAPDSIELIYDAYSAVTAGYGFTGRPSDTFIYVAAYTKRVNLGFYHGRELKDPKGLLQGTGNMSRHVPIEAASDLERPGLLALIRAAIQAAERPEKALPPASIVRAVYERKRRPV